MADHQRLCNNHTSIRIECKTADGNEAETTGEVFECHKDNGFTCRNIDQDGKTCSDYKFRLRCSSEKTGNTCLYFMKM